MPEQSVVTASMPGRGHRKHPHPPRRQAHRAAPRRRHHPAVSRPHHTMADVGLISGGQVPMPGAGSLAHHGILCLDELPEFRSHVLEVLRQPLEESLTRIHLPAHPQRRRAGYAHSVSGVKVASPFELGLAYGSAVYPRPRPFTAERLLALAVVLTIPTPHLRHGSLALDENYAPPLDLPRDGPVCLEVIRQSRPARASRHVPLDGSRLRPYTGADYL
jgi:hypothetical protein